MTTLSSKLDNIWGEARAIIINKVKEIGKETKDYSFKTIILDDERSFNLNRGYVKEIGEDNIINSEGNLYGFDVLTYEQLIDIADWIENLPNQKKVEPKTVDEAIGIIESKWGIDEYFENEKLCGYELNTYTDRGVNQIIFLDFRSEELDPKSLEDFISVFKEYINEIDIDEEITSNRHDENYRNDFSLAESLEDFQSWKNNLLEFYA